MDEQPNPPAKENCPICGKPMNKASIKRHINTVHSKDKQTKSKSTKGNKASLSVKSSNNIKSPNSETRNYTVPKDYDRNSLDDLDDFEMMECDSDLMSELTSSMSSVAISNYGTVNFTVPAVNNNAFPANINNNNNAPNNNSQVRNPPPTRTNSVPVGTIPEVKKKERNRDEEKVQLKLEKKTGYKHHTCPAGIIDLFSQEDGIIIEIKVWSKFKHAIGQLLCYNYFYPKHLMRAHFFGPIPADDVKIMILTICNSLHIQVTWEK